MRKSTVCWALMSLCFLVPAGAAETGPNCEVASWVQSAAVHTPGGIATLPFIEKPVLKSSCSASASCGSSPSVSCSGLSSCYAVDQDCSVGQRGFVLCDNVRTDCSSTCPPPPNPCDQLNQQFPGCNYTYDPQGSCCRPDHWSCPQEPCF